MDAAEARHLTNFYKGEPQSKRRKRGFTHGAVYQHLYPGYLEIDHEAMGDVDIYVHDILTHTMSLMKIRSAKGDAELMRGVIRLGELMPRKGNCRKDVGDIGQMFALGYRSKRQGLIYSLTGDEETKEAMSTLTKLVLPFLKDEYTEVLEDIQRAERSGAKVPALEAMGGEEGPGGSIMLSRNLGNSSHFDFSDGSASCSIWAEKYVDMAGNWYFVLPNLSIDGSSGTVVKLRHGVAISWDGRIIRHCSSVTDVGDGNNVYGCMFGSCRD
jgi:hypothetical protein